MVHAVTTRATQFPLFLSVTQHVGPGKANHPNDVSLVKFGLRMYGLNPGDALPPDPALSRQLASLTMNGSCGQDTIDAIKAYQLHRKKKFPQQTTDGVVSPAKDFGYGGDTAFTIVELCQAIRRGCPSWPAVHLDQNCPPNVAAVVKPAVFGTRNS